MFNRRLLNRLFSSVSFLVFAFGLVTTASSQTKLLRFPDIYGDRVVFTYGGDLWTAPAAGGSAVR